VHRDGDPAPAVLAVNQAARIEFSTSDLCKATGILLQHRGRYKITIEPGERWFNGLTRIGTPVGGFSSKDQPKWYERLYLSLLVPLRRELFKDWFRIVLRYGNVGGEEDSYEPDPYDDKIQFNITPTIAPNGKEQLFVFVNDAVIGIPGLYDLLYRKNRGTAVLTVTRTR
jgi:hypothetical protein